VDRRLIADRAVRALLVVVSALSLQLFLRIGKRHEPVRVQAFRPEASDWEQRTATADSTSERRKVGAQVSSRPGIPDPSAPAAGGRRSGRDRPLPARADSW
jgi:hypothetical protein